MNDGAEVRRAWGIFHRLAAEPGKACALPPVVRLKDGTITWSELDDPNL